MSKSRIEKNRRFVKIWVTFYRFWPLLELIGIYRKTGPTKSTVLGPGPPPGNFYKIYRFLPIFRNFGPSIEPEKPSVKSASTPYPPRKVNFIAYLSKFITNHGSGNLSLPITELLALYFGIGIVFYSFLFWYSVELVTLSFSGKLSCSFLLFVGPRWFIGRTRLLSDADKSPSNKGLSRRRQ
jgi:hypothetical protein